MVNLSSDATILIKTPPLRACWAKVGEQAEVPITGGRAKRVVSGARDVGTGGSAAGLGGAVGPGHLPGAPTPPALALAGVGHRDVHGPGSPQRAKRSRAPAAELGIELRWLPTACPERNPLEGLWRAAEGPILADELAPDLDVSLGGAPGHLEGRTPRQRLETAGVLSGAFGIPKSTTAASTAGARHSRLCRTASAP
jgi:hypothetical protein